MSLVIGTLPYEPIEFIPGSWSTVFRLVSLFGFFTMVGFGIAAVRYYQEIVRRAHEKERLMATMLHIFPGGAVPPLDIP